MLDQVAGPVFLVGHQPLMGRLLAWLTDRAEVSTAFGTSGLAAVELITPARGCGTLLWQISPGDP